MKQTFPGIAYRPVAAAILLLAGTVAPAIAQTDSAITVDQISPEQAQPIAAPPSTPPPGLAVRQIPSSKRETTSAPSRLTADCRGPARKGSVACETGGAPPPVQTLGPSAEEALLFGRDLSATRPAVSSASVPDATEVARRLRTGDVQNAPIAEAVGASIRTVTPPAAAPQPDPEPADPAPSNPK